jgi:hypothetical protein
LLGSLLSHTVPPTERLIFPAAPGSAKTVPIIHQRRRLLLGAHAVLFTRCVLCFTLPTAAAGGSPWDWLHRYAIATFMSAFFPQAATGMGFSGTLNGIIFAAYPCGMALASFFTSQVWRIRAMKALTRLMCMWAGFHLCSPLTVDPLPGCTQCRTVWLVLHVALAPDISSGDGTKAFFVITYFLNGAGTTCHTLSQSTLSLRPIRRQLLLSAGLTGALAETACIAMVSNCFQVLFVRSSSVGDGCVTVSRKVLQLLLFCIGPFG